MPKDEWANNRKPKRERDQWRPKKPKKAILERQRKILRDRLMTAEAPLWFGKYQGVKIKDIPRDYLRWMLDNLSPNGERMKAVLEFLRAYLT